MRRLEGRKLSETTLGSKEGSIWERYDRGDSDSEDGDPWVDPWQKTRARALKRLGSSTSSSVYSDAPEERSDRICPEVVSNLTGRGSDQLFGAQRQPSNAKSITCEQLSYPPLQFWDHEASELEAANQRDLAFQVRQALRGSYSTTGHCSELTPAPKAYSVVSKRISLTPSDLPYRLSWLQSRQTLRDAQDLEYNQARGTWRRASRSYDPMLRAETDGGTGYGQSSSRNEDLQSQTDQVLGWNHPRGQTPQKPEKACTSHRWDFESSESASTSNTFTPKQHFLGRTACDATKSHRALCLYAGGAFLVVLVVLGLVAAIGLSQNYHHNVWP